MVTLSSGEAELVALTQTTSESILVKKAWEFLVRAPAELVLRSDSSVARAIASRLGVGRVRHLQTSCLWVQQWVAQHLLKVLPVPTEFNPADLGTKCFAAKRLRLLCYLVGLVRDNGDHVGHHEFREAVARRAGNVDRNKDVVVRLVQLLAAANLLGCEFGPGGPDDLFEDLAALIYMTILFVVRYLWWWRPWPWFGSWRSGCAAATKRRKNHAQEQGQGEARPSGATSSTDTPGTTSLPVATTSARGNRKLEQANL